MIFLKNTLEIWRRRSSYQNFLFKIFFKVNIVQFWKAIETNTNILTRTIPTSKMVNTLAKPLVALQTNHYPKCVIFCHSKWLIIGYNFLTWTYLEAFSLLLKLFILWFSMLHLELLSYIPCSLIKFSNKLPNN